MKVLLMMVDFFRAFIDVGVIGFCGFEFLGSLANEEFILGYLLLPVIVFLILHFGGNAFKQIIISNHKIRG